MLMFTNWSNHIEILTSCKTNEERIFYILYAKKEKLKVRELQRAIKTNAFAEFGFFVMLWQTEKIKICLVFEHHH